MRNIIFHYHFFKNAGTSVDAFLQHNFPGQWVNKEFSSNRYPGNCQECQEWMLQERNKVAFSSHTALLPPPEIEGLRIFPIIFFRHPIDRIASAYAFEKKQGSDTPGSVLARQTDLKGYIETQLLQGRFSQCRNFHLSKLKHIIDSGGGNPISLAIKFINDLPFIGLVEQYDQSINRLVSWLLPYFPAIQPVTMAKNVSRELNAPLDYKLEKIAEQIGAETYQKLIDANAEDLVLYDHIKRRYL